MINQNSSKASRSMQPLRIAQLAPLFERIPPQLYGGTERVVSYLTEELVRRGHDVTLFASGDSHTAAKLRVMCPEALRLIGKTAQCPLLQLPMLSDVYENAEQQFDVIHSHIDFWTFPFAELMPRVPTVSTMHGRLDVADIHPVYHRYTNTALVSISNAQRAPLPEMNWISTIYHGLPQNLLRFNSNRGEYLAFLGRISYEKRPDIAIDVARRAGIPFKLAAKVDPVDRDYFEAMIKPRLAPPDIEYIGEIGETEKSEFLGNAMALLFTIDWPEPFGLAMIEALACGTPVISRPCGSVPEIIRSGKTGFIANTMDDLVAAVKNVEKLSREACRKEFEERFSIEVMAENYERTYHRLIEATQQNLRSLRKPKTREPHDTGGKGLDLTENPAVALSASSENG